MLGGLQIVMVQPGYNTFIYRQWIDLLSLRAYDTTPSDISASDGCQYIPSWSAPFWGWWIHLKWTF